jgi:4-amino-4-deoxy-L-arabinose transferase-like glycosyltransferase
MLRVGDLKLSLLLAVCLIILAFTFQGSRGIWQPDEGYYTGTAVTMLKKDTLLIPYLGEDEIFLDKPPMIYWGIIAGLKLFGHSDVLKESGIECRIVHLPYRRAMLFPCLTGKNSLCNEII